MMPAEGDGGAVGRSGRKSRANAGARLKDILQQEAKDLRVSVEGRLNCLMALAPVCVCQSWCMA